MISYRAAFTLSFLLIISSSSLADDIGEGRALLEANCARCHATGNEGASPLEKAPRFRDLVKRYEPESLAEALAEGIVTGHPDMPEFQFTPEQIGSIIAYLNSLK